MVRTLLLALAALAAPAVGAAQMVQGTYTALNNEGATVTLVLRQDGAGTVAGTISAMGNTFQIQGRLQGGGFAGTAQGPAGVLYVEGQAQGAQFVLTLAELGPDGQPDASGASQIVFTRAGQQMGAVPGGAPGGMSQPQGGAAPGMGGGLAAGPGDQQLTQLLTSSSWCARSHSTSGTLSTTTSEQVMFRPDGIVVVQTRETTSSADPTFSGVMQGRPSVQQYYWRVSRGMLNLSGDGASWEPQSLQVMSDGAGGVVIAAAGKRFTRC